jgi:hypothetical protein
VVNPLAFADLIAAFLTVIFRARVPVAVVFVVARFFAAFVAVLPKDAVLARNSVNTTAKMRENGGKSVMSRSDPVEIYIP